jgi:hypothetical protein
MKKKPLTTVAFRIDGDHYKQARKHYDVPAYVRWLMEALANKTIELETTESKMVFKDKKGQ